MAINKNLTASQLLETSVSSLQDRNTGKNTNNGTGSKLIIKSLKEYVENSRKFRRFSIDDNGGGYQGL